MKSIEDYVRTVPDFPKEGIMFRDVTTVLKDPDGFQLAIDLMMKELAGLDFDVIAGTESRGFIFASPIAYLMKKSLILVRKKGKLPFDTVSESYDLEYGSAEIEIHSDSIKKGEKVVLVDDLIATGGTMAASAKLFERLGGEVVRMVFLMELEGLEGRKILKDYDVRSIIKYPGK
ncbi:MAG: adenine phosphoribosyltransferase [Lachnospiraceae bacterium]|nr:adenine phosphoribosyltransferase [Lachnospiraceae bacterium]